MSWDKPFLFRSILWIASCDQIVSAIGLLVQTSPLSCCWRLARVFDWDLFRVSKENAVCSWRAEICVKILCWIQTWVFNRPKLASFVTRSACVFNSETVLRSIFVCSIIQSLRARSCKSCLFRLECSFVVPCRAASSISDFRGPMQFAILRIDCISINRLHCRRDLYVFTARIN